MAALIQSIASLPDGRAEGWDINSWDDYTGLFGIAGMLSQFQTLSGQPIEPVDPSLMGLTLQAYLRNSVVFSVLAIRARLFAEARFQFQQLRGGRPGSLFGTQALRPLENPEPGRTTGDLLAEMELDASLGGNGFVHSAGPELERLRPDWTYIAYGSPKRDTELGAWDPAARVIGVGHYPGGMGIAPSPRLYLPDEVAIYTPTKDPLARNRGVSLLTAGLREVLGDSAATDYKLSFFRNAATPNLALSFPAAMSKEKAKEWIELFDQEHRGAMNAFRTIFLGAGVTTTPVGLSFQASQFTELQAKAETRIAALAGVNPIVAALSEGLQGSSLNVGNFSAAARLVGDATLRPLWKSACGALERIVPPLPGTRLWTDDREVAFLREDVTDQAKILQIRQQTIGGYIRDGFTPASAIAAAIAGDESLLVHTGLVSVQLQPPGAALPGGGAAAQPSGPAAWMVTSADRGTIPATSVSALPPAPTGRFRATRDFWASEGTLASLGPVTAGTVLDAGSPFVSTYPSCFERLPDYSGLSVRELALRLHAEGMSVPDIAARVDRNPRHVRRLLSGGRDESEAPTAASMSAFNDRHRGNVTAADAERQGAAI
jgi:phage portal protein BeeE